MITCIIIIYVLAWAIAAYYITFSPVDEVDEQWKYLREPHLLLITVMSLTSIPITVLWPLFPFIAIPWFVDISIAKAVLQQIKKENTDATH